MTEWLKQSTAVTLKLGPFVDSADAVTAETTLTIAQADVRLSKNGGDIAQKNDATSATHDEGGWYDVPVNTTDTNTLGRLLVSVQESGALPVWKEYMVVPGQVWDSLFGADALQVHAVEMSAGLITASVIATDAIDADAIADNAINAGAIASDAITAAKIADGAIDAATFATGAITATAIAADAITAAKVADGTIDAATFAGGAINAAAIASGAITNAKFAAGAIDATAIADGAIDANTFAAGAINAAAIATNAIDADALATDAVTEIQSGLSTLSMSTALPGSPTADTVGDALKRSSVGIPLSAAGASGGLATYDDVNLGVVFGTVDDTTPADDNFTGNSALEDTIDDYYTGRFLIFTSNDLGARKISSYTASTRTFQFTGTTEQDADAPFDAAPANGASFVIFGFHGA